MTSETFDPSNTLTHCKALLLSIVKCVRHEELGKRTGRSSSTMEQSPPAQGGTRERGGKEE